MKCPKCGNETDAKFCPECGTEVQPTVANASTTWTQNTVTSNSYGSNDASKKKNSGLGIAGFVLSFFGPLALVGIILAIVDMAKDKKAEYKHSLSIAAIVIGVVMLLIFATTNGSDDKKTEHSTTQEETEVTESDDIKDEDDAIALEEGTNAIENEVDEAETSEETVSEQSEPEVEEEVIPKEEFVATCTDLNESYKSIARDPSGYIGQNFYYTCLVSSVREGGMLTGYQKYYITYAFDMDKAQDAINRGWADDLEDARYTGMDYDTCVWVSDNRNESDPEYVKVIENDIVTIYGTFNGLAETKNSLTGETGEQMALDVKYVDLIAE
ncbi:MAG: hypothetical protein J6N76_00130 [Lachnospiraceae bacterium]|nr:hypothetical protein [Lachnospiraceae bacterium]